MADNRAVASCSGAPRAFCACAGACASDYKSFCKDVSQGEGRFAACLAKRVAQQKAGNAVGERQAHGWRWRRCDCVLGAVPAARRARAASCAGRLPAGLSCRAPAPARLGPRAGRKVTDKCLDELLQFKLDRSSNINKDVPLGEALLLLLGWGQPAPETTAQERAAAVLRARSAGVQGGRGQALQGRQRRDVPRQHRAVPQVRTRADRAPQWLQLQPPLKGAAHTGNPLRRPGCRVKKAKLGATCKAEVFRVQKEVRRGGRACTGRSAGTPGAAAARIPAP